MNQSCVLENGEEIGEEMSNLVQLEYILYSSTAHLNLIFWPSPVWISRVSLSRRLERLTHLFTWSADYTSHPCYQCNVCEHLDILQSSSYTPLLCLCLKFLLCIAADDSYFQNLVEQHVLCIASCNTFLWQSQPSPPLGNSESHLDLDLALNTELHLYLSSFLIPTMMIHSRQLVYVYRVLKF